MCLILLWADPDLLLGRLRKRDGLRAKHASVEDVVQEAQAERHYWNAMSQYADLSRSYDTGALETRLLVQRILEIGIPC